MGIIKDPISHVYLVILLIFLCYYKKAFAVSKNRNFPFVVKICYDTKIWENVFICYLYD